LMAEKAGAVEATENNAIAERMTSFLMGFSCD